MDLVGISLSRRAFLAALAALPLLREEELPPAAQKVIRERFGDRPIRTGHVQLDAPESAPDGRTVPLFIESDLPMTPADYVKSFHVIVDHNPDVYLAGFHLTPAMGEAAIDTRIKMRRSSHVRVIAETSRGELWSAAQMVYVTMNGCV
ncbi:MAG TPA: thiosulfate oxidation carrier protein SoxY [Gemmatimonadaceae bacterium]|nr:thiosulfate oxidation carrier protein SoxY [Gemmatimonadaceae bacterium]